jgi:hypothetical protein
MPTNTFENLATITVSGSSTSAITFSGINTSTYRHFMVIGWVGVNSNATIGFSINGATSGNTWNVLRVGDAANGQPVPVGALITNNDLLRITEYAISSAASYGASFRITIANPRSGAVNALVDSAANNSGARPYYTMGSGYYLGTMTSLSIKGYGGEIFRAGSVVSLYGVI